jgi:hypothetical protein
MNEEIRDMKYFLHFIVNWIKTRLDFNQVNNTAFF